MHTDLAVPSLVLVAALWEEAGLPDTLVADTHYSWVGVLVASDFHIGRIACGLEGRVFGACADSVVGQLGLGLFARFGNCYPWIGFGSRSCCWGVWVLVGVVAEGRGLGTRGVDVGKHLVGLGEAYWGCKEVFEGFGG